MSRVNFLVSYGPLVSRRLHALKLHLMDGMVNSKLGGPGF